VFRMKLLGANVVSVDSGSRTLKDAMNEAMREWVARVDDTFYIIGTAAGPAPYPEMVRDFQCVIGNEAKEQMLEAIGRQPDVAVACVGGGSNAIGMFADFIDDPSVALYGVEPAGEGLNSGHHGAAIHEGKVGVLHGARSYLMRTDEGQVEESYSISAGLDYPGVGPQHAYLAASGRAHYVGITDDEAVNAFIELSRHEGIIPAMESSHALAYALKMARELKDTGHTEGLDTREGHVPTLLVCLSGRGDKDLDQVRERLGGSFSRDGAVARAAELVAQERAGFGTHRTHSYDLGSSKEER